MVRPPYQKAKGELMLVLLRQFCVIVAICFIGEFLNKLFGIPIPGNVLGMVLFLILLITGIVKLEMVDKIAKFLLDHLAFFFIPAGVNLLTNLDMLRGQWITIMSVIVLTTISVMVVTGWTIQWAKRRWLV